MAQLDNDLCVMKFGGTSVQDAGCIKRTAEIIASSTSPVVTIVSAMGGVTNRLIAAAHQSATGDETAGENLKEALLPVSYTHLRAHETPEHLVCRLLLEK